MSKLQGWDIDTGDKVEFTKFPEGVTKIRLVDTVPHIRWTHWMTRESRSANCPGKSCPICEIRNAQKANKEDYTYNMSRRFALQILNRNTNKLEIMEQGITFFEDLKMVLQMAVEDGLELDKFDLSVRRRGTGREDTAYRIDIAEKYELTDRDKELMQNTVDLNEFFAPHTPEQLKRVIDGEEWDKVMYGDEDSEEGDFELE